MSPTHPPDLCDVPVIVLVPLLVRQRSSLARLVWDYFVKRTTSRTWWDKAWTWLIHVLPILCYSGWLENRLTALIKANFLIFCSKFWNCYGDFFIVLVIFASKFESPIALLFCTASFQLRAFLHRGAPEERKSKLAMLKTWLCDAWELRTL